MCSADSRPASPYNSAWLAAEGARLLRFAAGAAHPEGGFAWLDDDGKPQVNLPVYTWITCRMTHIFALGTLAGVPGCAGQVDRGVSALRGQLRDAQYGGWYPAVAHGSPVTSQKCAYEHAFVVLAASSAVATAAPGSGPLLEEALHVFDKYFWDASHGLVVDTWDRSWSRLDSYRGVNPNMHAIEALLAAADVTGEEHWRQRALSIAAKVVHGFARGNAWLLPEHFDPNWNPDPDYNRDNPGDQFRPYGVTIGHLLEWSRLCLHLRAALGDAAPDWLLDDAVALFDTAVTAGWTSGATPGFVYTVDWARRPVVTERLHWVVAEAIAAAAALHQATGDRRYADWYDRWWQHAEAFIDRVRGSWHHELDAANRPSAEIWQGKPDAYHQFQATLIPRLPLAPTLATGVRAGLLDAPGSRAIATLPTIVNR
jgi:mannose/cellobiose epimerase-like protein (N-acyl-D-glucosamine 2-epimerase family)